MVLRLLFSLSGPFLLLLLLLDGRTGRNGLMALLLQHSIINQQNCIEIYISSAVTCDYIKPVTTSTKLVFCLCAKEKRGKKEKKSNRAISTIRVNGFTLLYTSVCV